jgi:hypothetical protein
MRNVRRLGRRTWLAGLGGGALAVVAGLKLGGRDGYGIRIALPDGRPAAAQGMHGDPIQGGASAAFQGLVAAIEASGGLAHAPAPDHAST